MTVARILVFVFAICFAGAAQAQVDVIFSTAASACVPSDATTKLNRHKTGNLSVQPAPNVVDPIVLTCAFPYYEGATPNWVFGMTYVNSTGSFGGAFVRARLFRAPIMDSDAAELIAAVNSNSSSVTTLNTIEANFAHDFDPSGFIYWVRVDIDRSLTSQTAILHSLFVRVART